MNIIEIKKVVKEYPLANGEGYLALRGVDLLINQGEMVAIMGPSGSGKSTLMHILGLLDKPTSGKYFLNSKDVSSLTSSESAKIRNREVGFVFQSFNLLPRTTVFDNVSLPLVYAGVGEVEIKKRVMGALSAVSLESKSDNMSNQISGGQVQRVAIARAIVTGPSIILADEPTGNLDTKTSLEIMEIFVKMNNAGNTVILITHEPDIARFCKRVITLRDGQIIEDKKNGDR